MKRAILFGLLVMISAKTSAADDKGVTFFENIELGKDIERLVLIMPLPGEFGRSVIARDEAKERALKLSKQVGDESKETPAYKKLSSELSVLNDQMKKLRESGTPEQRLELATKIQKFRIAMKGEADLYVNSHKGLRLTLDAATAAQKASDQIWKEQKEFDKGVEKMITNMLAKGFNVEAGGILLQSEDLTVASIIDKNTVVTWHGLQKLWIKGLDTSKMTDASPIVLKEPIIFSGRKAQWARFLYSLWRAAVGFYTTQDHRCCYHSPKRNPQKECANIKTYWRREGIVAEAENCAFGHFALSTLPPPWPSPAIGDSSSPLLLK